MAVMIVESPGSRKTTSAALRAASEAPSTAIPQLAMAKDGASLTPILRSRSRKFQLYTGLQTVSSHGGKMSTRLQHFHHLVLVLGENLGKTISCFNKIMDLFNCFYPRDLA